jgi:hypothetical protein
MNLGDVKRHAARALGITRQDLDSPSRSARFARPRQVAMRICRQYSRASLQRIGASFGGRDHTTVLHAFKAVERRCIDPKYAREVAIACAVVESEILHQLKARQNRPDELQLTNAPPKAFLPAIIPDLPLFVFFGPTGPSRRAMVP